MSGSVFGGQVIGFNTVKALSYTNKDVGYICMPLCHSNSMYLNFMPALVVGASIGLRNKFSASRFVSDISRIKATIWNCVGKPVTYVLSTVKDTDYSHLPLRVVISTGTTADEQQQFSKIFGLEMFVEAYGSTETGAVTVKTPNDEPCSVGKRNPAKPFIILNEKSNSDGSRDELNRDEIGEIAVQNDALGDSAFQGYYRDPDASQKRFYTHTDGKVYYLTGDLGKIDNQDHLYFMGRTGEWFRKKGENRSEIAAEEYLGCFKGIISIVVFGMPDAASQEDCVVAVIETPDPQSFDIQGFVDYANSGDRGIVPDFIRLVKVMPTTKTLKILKNQIKQKHIKRTGASLEQNTDIIYAVNGTSVNVFDRQSYKEHLDSYSSQSRERLYAFLERNKTQL